MAKGQLKGVIQHLRRVALRRDGAGLTDSELLECYLTWRDEAAFESLLERHGPMVLGVCRRILRNEADAHDAFQATFLVFLRKAASIGQRAQVGNWLYGVAHKTALKVRAMNCQRRAKEKQAETTLWTAPQDQVKQELLGLLDEVLSRLPDKHRAPIVLCDLEGKSLKEAAQQLGCPAGTVASRLARARGMLAKRLAHTGLSLAGGGLATALAEEAASACVPTSLVASTVKAATAVAAGQAAATGMISTKVVALTERVVKAMLMTRLKFTMTMLLAVTLLGSGGVLLTYRTLRAEQTGTKQENQLLAALQKDKDANSDRIALQGTWVAVSGQRNGEELPYKRVGLVFAGDKVIRYSQPGRRGVGIHRDSDGTYEIDSDKEPKEIDLIYDFGTIKGIYELKGTTLKWAYKEGERPTNFDSQGANFFVFEKKKDAKEEDPSQAAAQKEERAKSDKETLQGTWVGVSGEKNGEKLSEFQLKNWEKLVFEDDKVTREGGERREGTYTIAPDKKPKEIDLLINGKTVPGIYELKDTTLKLVVEFGAERATDFDSKGSILIIFEKQK